MKMTRVLGDIPFRFLFIFSLSATLGIPPGSPVEGVFEASAETNKPARVVDPFQRLKEGVVRFELSNGLRVLLYRRDIAPVFAGQTWVKVGGVNEFPGMSGISHLLEHMAFKGTRTIGTRDYKTERSLLDRFEQLMEAMSELPLHEERRRQVEDEIRDVENKLNAIWVDNEFSRLYQERGATGLNAMTSKDFTQYMVALPVSAFEFWCWMESERILNPVFRQFYKEREVVIEERRTRFDDHPGGKLYETLLSTAFHAHPNRIPVIGYRSDLEQLTMAELERFYRTYYRPDNMVLAIVGDVDPQTARPLIERYFGRIPRSEGRLPRVRTQEPPQLGPREAVVEFDAEPQLMLGYHKPTYPHPDDAHFAVLHSLLASGRSSLLERELVQKRQLATSIMTSEAPGIQFPNIFFIGATPRPGVSSRVLRDEIQKILDGLKERLVSVNELEEAKRRVRVELLKSLPSNGGLAAILGQSELIFHDWQAIFKSYDVIAATSAEDIRELARRYLNENNRSFVELRRKKSHKDSPKV